MIIILIYMYILSEICLIQDYGEIYQIYCMDYIVSELMSSWTEDELFMHDICYVI